MAYFIGLSKKKIDVSDRIGKNMQGFARDKQIITTTGDLYARAFYISKKIRPPTLKDSYSSSWQTFGHVPNTSSSEP